MQRGWIRLIVLAIILVSVASFAACTLFQITITIKEAEKAETPTRIAPLYPQPAKSMFMRLFGKESPTLFDCISKVLEMPDGKKKVQELINSYGAVVFREFGVAAEGLKPNYSIRILMSPLCAPENCTVFSFPYNENNDSFSFTIFDTKEFDWHYRNLTEEELDTLLKTKLAESLLRYKNRFFIAAEMNYDGSSYLKLEGFAWKKEAVNVNEFNAYEGVRVVVYEDGRNLDNMIDEIIVIISKVNTAPPNSSQLSLFALSGDITADKRFRFASPKPHFVGFVYPQNVIRNAHINFNPGNYREHITINHDITHASGK